MSLKLSAAIVGVVFCLLSLILNTLALLDRKRWQLSWRAIYTLLPHLFSILSAGMSTVMISMDSNTPIGVRIAYQISGILGFTLCALSWLSLYKTFLIWTPKTFRFAFIICAVLFFVFFFGRATEYLLYTPETRNLWAMWGNFYPGGVLLAALIGICCAYSITRELIGLSKHHMKVMEHRDLVVIQNMRTSKRWLIVFISLIVGELVTYAAIGFTRMSPMNVSVELNGIPIGLNGIALVVFDRLIRSLMILSTTEGTASKIIQTPGETVNQ